MNNKRHHIIDDAWEMVESNLGGAEHSLRVGLVVNTVIKAMPVVVDDILSIVVDKPKFDHKLCEADLPVLLNFQHGEIQIAILLVYDKSSSNIQCYPFGNLNEGHKWWLYEMAFDLVPGGLIEIRPVHPMLDAVEFDPTKEMMSHLESLATIVGSFLERIQDGTLSVERENVDYSRLNKKRAKKGKEAIVNDWKAVLNGK